MRYGYSEAKSLRGKLVSSGRDEREALRLDKYFAVSLFDRGKEGTGETHMMREMDDVSRRPASAGLLGP